MTTAATKAMEPAESRPVPDPTTLTTQQLIREIGAVREIIETRLDGMDKAIELLQKSSDKFPEFVKSEVVTLFKLHQEKFESVQTQFQERDVRDERSSRDSKTAVDAALSAAKEAVGAQNASSALAIAKSETATDKRIDQQGTLIANATKALDDKIDDLKERLTRIEGKAEGKVTAVADHQTNTGMIVGIIGAVFMVIFGLAGIAIALYRK